MDLCMEDVGDNEEQPATQIVRSRIGMRDGQSHKSWGWCLEVTEDEEGTQVATRMGALDWGRLQAAIAMGLKDISWTRRRWARSPHWATMCVWGVGPEEGGCGDPAGEGGRR